MNPWSDLPNAKYIDDIIGSVATDPKKWSYTWNNSGGVTPELAAFRDAAWVKLRETGRGQIYYDVRNKINSVSKYVWTGVRDTMLALIAYDDRAYLIHEKPDDIKLLAGIGDESAALLRIASLVFSEIKNESLV